MFYLPELFKPDIFIETDIDTILSLITGNNLSNITTAINSKANYDTIMNLGINIRKERDPNKQKRLKQQLPCFGMAHFDGRVDDSGFRETEYIIFDIDNLDMQRLNVIKNEVSSFSFLCFNSIRSKGIKFVIKLSRPVNLADYRASRDYHRQFFSKEFDVDLDTSYNAHQTFLSIDANAFYNPKCITFDVVESQQKEVFDKISSENILSDELADVTKALNGIYTDNETWFRIGLAYGSFGQRAERYFKSLEASDKENFRDHNHRDYNKLWERAVRTNRAINAGTLFYIAEILTGYKRKQEYVVASTSKDFPFKAATDGKAYLTDKNELAFSFNEITCLYKVESLDKEPSYIYGIKGFSNGEVEMSASDLSNITKFKNKLMSARTTDYHPLFCFKGNPQQENIVYKKLANYFFMQILNMEEQKEVIMKNGLGCITSRKEWDEYGYMVWNFGSHILYGRKQDGEYVSEIVPFTDNFKISDKYTMQLENLPKRMETIDFNLHQNNALIKDIKELKKFYGNDLAIILGWTVAEAFYKFYDYPFPILMLNGKTAAGKTSLAKLILSMFGVWGTMTQATFLTNLTGGTTKTFLERARDRSHCIPIAVDEARHNSKETYQLLISGFEGKGKGRAKFSNDNQVHTSFVYCGTIFMTPENFSAEELQNRCISLELDRVEDINKRHEHALLIINSRKLSSFIAYVLTKVSPDKMREQLLISMKKLMELYKKVTDIDARELTNYAFVHAGYTISNELGLVETVPDDFWKNRASSQVQYKKITANLGMVLLQEAMGLCSSSHKGKWFDLAYLRRLNGEQLMDEAEKNKIHLAFSIEKNAVYIDLYVKLSDKTVLQELLNNYKRNNPDAPLSSVHQVKEHITSLPYIVRWLNKTAMTFSNSGTWSIRYGELDMIPRDGKASAVIYCPRCYQPCSLDDKYCENSDCVIDKGFGNLDRQKLPLAHSVSGLTRLIFPANIFDIIKDDKTRDNIINEEGVPF